MNNQITTDYVESTLLLFHKRRRSEPGSRHRGSGIRDDQALLVPGHVASLGDGPTDDLVDDVEHPESNQVLSEDSKFVILQQSSHIR